MALVIPRSVGGTAENVAQAIVEPIERRAANLVIPASVGGEVGAIEPTQPIEQPIQPAQPLSQIIPEAAQAVTQTVQQAQVPETGIADIFTGAERIAATPELGTVPEFAETPTSLNNIAVQLGMLSTFDEKAQLDIIKENIPEATFDKTPDGSTFINIPLPDGTVERSVLNRPGFSEQDLFTASAQFLAFLSPARLANLGRGLAQKFGIGAAAAGATEQALQEVGVELGREQRDPTGTAIAAVTGGAAEVVLPAIQTFRQARQARTLGVERAAVEEVRPLIESAEEVTRQTGVQLAPAQKTLDPFALEEQSFLASLPSAARTAVRFLRTQNEQAQAAVRTFFSDLAPSTALQTGNVRARDAAKSVVQLTRDIRNQATEPFYKKAFQAAKSDRLVVNVDETVEILNNALAKTKSPSPAHSELLSKKKLIENSAKVSRTVSAAGEPTRPRGSNLSALHRAKVLLAEAIERKGEKGLDPTVRGDLSQSFNSLKQVMESASPDYRDAQRIFAQASGPVDDILVSKIGQISRISDEKINSVSRQIFDESITDPEVIKQTRAAIESIDPNVWSSVVRVEAQRRLKNIDLDVANLTPDNAPGKIVRALFGSGNKRSIFLSSLTNGQMKNAIFLEDALKRAARGRPGGSQTGVRAVITEKLKGASLSIRRFLKNPIERLIATGEESAFNRNASSLARSVFDPKWEPRLSKIRKLKSDSPAATRAMTQLLDDIGKEEEQ